MKRIFIKFYLFGTLGLSSEIFYTAGIDLYHMLRGDISLNGKLQGVSYVWMFFIYGLTAFLFPPVYKIIERFPMLIRLLILAGGIFIVEFITGWMLDITTGKCPWEYTSRWNVCGYIRLDYLPIWMFFAFILEKANTLFDKLVKNMD
jgi:hypothetical protein